MDWSSKLKNIGKNGSREEKQPILNEHPDLEKVIELYFAWMLQFEQLPQQSPRINGSSINEPCINGHKWIWYKWPHRMNGPRVNRSSPPRIDESAVWPSGSECCFYDDHDRKVDGSTPTQALSLRPWIRCFTTIISLLGGIYQVAN